MKPDSILIVDDVSKNLQLLGTVLLQNNYDISYARDGKQALKAVEEKKFDLILLDIMMPEMDGFEVCKRLKINPETKDIPIIFLSAKSEKESIVYGFELGAEDYITKPFNSAELVARVKTHLELKKLRENLATQVEEKTKEIQDIINLKERTVNASFKILSEILSITNSAAFSRTNRITKYVKHIINELRLEDSWIYEISAYLSQIGCLAVPEDIIVKVYSGNALSEEEQKIFEEHPVIAKKLLVKFPQMQKVASIIGGQLLPYSYFTKNPFYTENEISLGAQILKVANDFEIRINRRQTKKDALSEMKQMKHEYNPKLLNALNNIAIERRSIEIKFITIEELHTYMQLEEDIYTKSNVKIASAGQDVNYTLIERLKSYKKRVGIIEPIKVRVFE